MDIDSAVGVSTISMDIDSAWQRNQRHDGLGVRVHSQWIVTIDFMVSLPPPIFGIQTQQESWRQQLRNLPQQSSTEPRQAGSMFWDTVHTVYKAAICYLFDTASVRCARDESGITWPFLGTLPSAELQQQCDKYAVLALKQTKMQTSILYL